MTDVSGDGQGTRVMVRNWYRLVLFFINNIHGLAFNDAKSVFSAKLNINTHYLIYKDLGRIILFTNKTNNMPLLRIIKKE